MKESYIYSNGEVLVDCHFDIQRREYQDNIENILETENIIEGLKSEKENYKESIRLKKLNVMHNIKSNTIVVAVSIIIGFTMMICESFINPFVLEQGIKLWVGTGTSVGTLAILSPIILNNLKNNKVINREIHGLNLALNNIDKMIKDNEYLLNELENDKSKNNEEFAKQVKEHRKVDYKEKLQEFKNLLNLYCTIGANEESFKEYYEKGWLDSKLERDFNSSDIKTIKTYFKNKKTK